LWLIFVICPIILLDIVSSPQLTCSGPCAGQRIEIQKEKYLYGDYGDYRGGLLIEHHCEEIKNVLKDERINAMIHYFMSFIHKNTEGDHNASSQ
jgi:hypothetical protein